jgi:serine/threonine protein kinase
MSVGEQSLQVGQLLDGRYLIVSGETVQDIWAAYKAYDMELDRLVVIHLLSSHFKGDTEALERVALSDEVVSSLMQPERLPFDGSGLVGERLYLVRSHAEGETLSELFARAGSIETDEAVEIATRLSELLAPFHRAGLHHGNLSPHSVMVAENGRVSLLDAGLMPTLWAGSTPPDQSWRRLPYLSPEQAAGEAVLPASDVYSLGLLLYEMLSGRPPFRSSDPTKLALQYLRQEPVPLQTLAPNVPLPLALIVHKALAKEPSARYRNAGQLAHILRSQAENQLAPSVPGLVARGPALRPGLVSSRPGPSASALLPERVERSQPQAYAWIEEPSGTDWLMIGLIIAALVAILGLIPLWRAVYRRYSAPQPATTPLSYHLPGGCDSLRSSRNIEPASQVSANIKLEDLRLVWYNCVLSKQSVAKAGRTMFNSQRVPAFRSPDYGFGGVLYYTVKVSLVEAEGES